jgi:hypothetical protein
MAGKIFGGTYAGKPKVFSASQRPVIGKAQ